MFRIYQHFVCFFYLKSLFSWCGRWFWLLCLVCLTSVFLHMISHSWMHQLQVAYHTPPRFPLDVIKSIRDGASILFQRLGLLDFARIDGWFLPPSAPISSSENNFGKTESGTIIFTDINLVRRASEFLHLLITYHFYWFSLHAAILTFCGVLD